MKAKELKDREKIISLVKEINRAANGEAFYARIFLSKERLTGLIDEFKVNDKVIFNLTEEKFVNKRAIKEARRIEVRFSEIKEIVPFKTISGKPLSILDIEEEVENV
jgi:hypothetical protein